MTLAHGKCAVGSNDGTILLFYLSDRTPRVTFETTISTQSSSPICSLSWNNDGTMLACGKDLVCIFRLKNTGALTLHSHFTKHSSGIKAIYWDSNTHLITGGDCGKVYEWDINRPESYNMIADCKGQITGLARQKNGDVVTSLGIDKGGIRVWKAGKIVAKYESGAVIDMSVSDKYIVSVCNADMISLFIVPTVSKQYQEPEENRYLKIR